MNLRVTAIAGLLLGVCMTGPFVASAQPLLTDDDWASVSPANATTTTAVLADAHGNVYVGGDFRAIGRATARHIARWDGSQWAPLGTGLDHAPKALTLLADDLCAAVGSRVLRWDGQSWSPLGDGFNGTVLSLSASGDELYAGGEFTAVGDVTVNHIARWDGTAWSALGAGVNGTVSAITESGGILYAGGSFTEAGGISANHIASWNGEAWSALADGVDGEVNALAFMGTTLVVGGSFTNAGGVPANAIASWDGNGWSSLGSSSYWSPPATVSALHAHGPDLYVCGVYFVEPTSLGVDRAWRVARWNGEQWTAISHGGPYYPYFPRVLTVSTDGDLFVGGNLRPAAIGAGVFRWDGQSFSRLGANGRGINGAVKLLAAGGHDLYVAGDFNSVDGSPLPQFSPGDLVKWDGTAWTSYAESIQSWGHPGVTAVAVAGSEVYVAGPFAEVDGKEANYIARWDGTTWSAPGSGIESKGGSYAVGVNTILVADTDVYVGGYFGQAGGKPANNIARWDGTNWFALGSGIDVVEVSALAMSGSDLYVGGFFYNAGGVEAHNIARWNGSSWSPLSSGTDGHVRALAVIGTDLYVAGLFYRAGGLPARNIARWDGNSWAAVGTGTDNEISAMAVHGTHLYVAGHFTTAGGVSANHIARWDGSSWTAIGSGTDGSVWRLAVLGDILYVGGEFSVAGGKASGNLARIFLGGTPSMEINGPRATAFFRGMPAGGYHVDRTTDFITWENLATRYAGETGGIDFTDEEAPPDKAFYRAVPVEP